MADDNRDFIERTESVTEKLSGKPMPADEMVENFALYGLKKRAAALENFDSELRGEIDFGDAQSSSASTTHGATQENGQRASVGRRNNFRSLP